jgi:hypothetical protein
MASTADVMHRYVELTNSPGSPSFPLFGPAVEWWEVHSNRRGGREELFAAMRQSREAFDNVKLELKSLIIDGESAALEGKWSARMIAGGALIAVPLVFIFGVRDGKIVKEIDYVIMPS